MKINFLHTNGVAAAQNVATSLTCAVRGEVRENRYFYLAFGIIFLVLFLEFPTLSYRSEIWAEQGTNYLYNARYLSVFKNLLVTDAGYLVIFPRIIALLAYHIFPVAYFPLVTNLCALLFTSFSPAFFSRKGFRHIIPSDFVRFIISLLLGFGMSNDYENHTFVNFVYHGMYLCFFMLFYDKAQMKRLPFILITALNALVCASKFHFVLFFVPYAAMGLWAAINRRRRDAVFYGASVLMILVQLGNLLRTYKTSALLSGSWPVANSMGGLARAIPVLAVKSLMFHMQAYANKLALIYCVFIAAAVCYAVARLYREKRLTSGQLMFFVAANYVSFGYLAVSSLVHLKAMKLGSQLGMGRTAFVAVEITFVAVAFAAYHAYRIKKSLLLPVALFLLYGHNIADFKNHPLLNHGPYQNPENSRSQWKAYRELFSYDDYFIPINPEVGTGAWTVRKDCEVVGQAVAGIDAEISIDYNASLRAIYYDFDGVEISAVQAYAHDGTLLGEGAPLVGTYGRRYILFKQKVAPDYIAFLSKNGIPVPLREGTRLTLLGTLLPAETDEDVDMLFAE